MSNWLKEYNAFWDETGENLYPPRELEEFAGIYANPAFGRVSVDLRDGELEPIRFVRRTITRL